MTLFVERWVTSPVDRRTLSFQCWADVQTVLSRTGRDNPLQLMHEFDPSEVPQHIADRVDSILCRYRLDEVRLASHGAATLYVWVS